MAHNRFGLSRNIPSEVKRQVRQACGFGCVNCGLAVAQYDHIDPPWAEASRHDAEAIALLCGACHDKKTRGLLSVATIKAKRASPKSFEKGFASDFFDVSQVSCSVGIGNNIATNTRVVLRILGDEIISLQPPNSLGEPINLNVTIADYHGGLVLQIVNNELRVGADLWDVVVQGRKLSICRRRSEQKIILRSQPPNFFAFETLALHHRGSWVFVSDGQPLQILRSNGQKISVSKFSCQNCDIGVDLAEGGMGSGEVFGVILICNQCTLAACPIINWIREKYFQAALKFVET
jgi:hypothetical protein